MKLTYDLIANMLEEWKINISVREMNDFSQLKVIQMLMEKYLADNTLTWSSYADVQELLKPGQYHGKQENGYTESYNGGFSAWWGGEHSHHQTEQEAKAWVEGKAISAGYGIVT